jgi:site-specific recombinase XerD
MEQALKQQVSISRFEMYEEFFENFSSQNTRISYQNDIQQFLEFVAERNVKIKKYTQIERLHVIKFRNWLQEFGGRNDGGCAPKTISRKLASISSYFDYMVEKGIAKINPATSVKRPRREVITPTNAMNREQVKELFGAIDGNKTSGPLHNALLITFFTTGLRKSEILNLKRKDYIEIDGHQIIQYKGKGGKVGRKVVHNQCKEALAKYFEWMKTQEREHMPNDWIFQPTRNPHEPGNLNKPLNPKTINEIIINYAKKIGLGFRISPHSARATFIGELLEVGIDIYQVALEVNHSSVKTTQEYDKRRKEISKSPVVHLKFD